MGLMAMTRAAKHNFRGAPDEQEYDVDCCEYVFNAAKPGANARL
jgi:hypothetical protein